MDTETRDTLAALTEALMTVARNAFYAHEMAHSLYRVMANEHPHPLEFREMYSKASLELDQLIRERGEILQQLTQLSQKLTQTD